MLRYSHLRTNSRRYGLGMFLLLPIFEHLLRKLFVSANQCPERLLTAEVCTVAFARFDYSLCRLPRCSPHWTRYEC